MEHPNKRPEVYLSVGTKVQFVAEPAFLPVKVKNVRGVVARNLTISPIAGRLTRTAYGPLYVVFDTPTIYGRGCWCELEHVRKS